MTDAFGTCMTCAFFEHDNEHEADEGNCKRHPPVACFDHEDGIAVTVWPLVTWMDWCGEHVPADEQRRV